MAEAHDVGLVHRDLKPDNIMVEQVDGADFVRVLDNGIAKFENSSTGLTADGTVIGTPKYMSPEQIQGLVVDRRSDIYAVGIILYEMVAGRPPFMADNPMTVAYMHNFEVPTPPSTLAAVPAPLEAVILQCLEKDRDDRAPSAAELRERLAAASRIDGRKSGAQRRGSGQDRSGRFGRNRAAQGPRQGGQPRRTAPTHEQGDRPECDCRRCVSVAVITSDASGPDIEPALTTRSAAILSQPAELQPSPLEIQPIPDTQSEAVESAVTAASSQIGRSQAEGLDRATRERTPRKPLNIHLHCL